VLSAVVAELQQHWRTRSCQLQAQFRDCLPVLLIVCHASLGAFWHGMENAFCDQGSIYRRPGTSSITSLVLSPTPNPTHALLHPAHTAAPGLPFNQAH
jgi:hypothetical protein